MVNGMGIAWLDPWWPTDGKGAAFHATFLAQLARELSPDHPLYGLPVRLIARGLGDDALFALDDGTGRVAVVHLTWSSQQQRLPWPATQIFADLDAFVHECLQPDHAAWLGDDEE